MGRAPALLSRRHGLLLAALGAGLVAYYEANEELWRASTWWDIAFLSFLLIPAVFALVWTVLPLSRALQPVRFREMIPVALAFGALAWILEQASWQVPANFAKLALTTALGFWFLRYFESVSWVVLVACVVPFVDAYSVWRGPTHTIVTERPKVFTTLSFAFPVPGEHAAANLGLPDLLFFALFLAAAVRFGLRVRWTWLALAASFGATMAIAVWADVAGLPALPGLSLAFLGVNADLLWHRLRAPRAEEVPSGTSP